MPKNTSNRVDDQRSKNIQQVIGIVLHYTRVVYLIACVTLSSSQIMCPLRHRTPYHSTIVSPSISPRRKIRHHASDTILNIYSNASSLSGERALSIIARQYFLGSKPLSNKPILINKAVLTIYTISSKLLELKALIMNCKEGK